MPENSSDLLKTREQYFGDADLHKLPIFCGDERPSDSGLYIHQFGGIANPAYTLMVLAEANDPGSAQTPLDRAVTDLIPVLKERSIDAGVHSDDHAEHGDKLQTDKEIGKIGCGYLELRQNISQLIIERGREIVAKLKEIDPVLYGSQHNRDRAFDFCRAHGRMIRQPIYPIGRKVALSAVAAGAPHNIVRGDHLGKAGIINKRSGTLDSNQAFKDGMPTYDHDSWAALDTYDEIKDLYSFDRTDYEIANDVDAVGTMFALGVEDIAVRR